MPRERRTLHANAGKSAGNILRLSGINSVTRIWIRAACLAAGFGTGKASFVPAHGHLPETGSDYCSESRAANQHGGILTSCKDDMWGNAATRSLKFACMTAWIAPRAKFSFGYDVFAAVACIDVAQHSEAIPLPLMAELEEDAHSPVPLHPRLAPDETSSRDSCSKGLQCEHGLFAFQQSDSWRWDCDLNGLQTLLELAKSEEFYRVCKGLPHLLEDLKLQTTRQQAIGPFFLTMQHRTLCIRNLVSMKLQRSCAWTMIFLTHFLSHFN